MKTLHELRDNLQAALEEMNPLTPYDIGYRDALMAVKDKIESDYEFREMEDDTKDNYPTPYQTLTGDFKPH